MLGRLISLMAVLALSACSVDTIDDTDVNQDKFYGDYRVTFDAAEKEVRHYVQFRVGGSTGTTIRLTEGRIEYDGNEMSVFDGDEAFINLSGTFYRRSYAADMPNASYTYTWIRSDGQRFDNVATMPAPFSIERPTNGESLSIDSALTVVMEGDALGSNETYSLELQTLNAMSGESIYKQTESGSEIVISAEEMGRMPPGSALIRVWRTRSERTQAGHTDAGGRIETKYSVGEIQVELLGTEIPG